MRLAHAALLLLLAVSCARSKPETTVPEPQVAAPRPRTPPPAPTPAEPAAPRPAPPKAPAPAPRAGTPAPPAAPKAGPPVAKAPAPAPSLDLNALTERLKETKAIGFFTKITLKNQVDDLLDQFRAYHQGKAKVTMTDLRRSYELMMMKVLSLLQDEDQALSSAIVSSREAIWGLLADPKKFAALQG
ncbi:MAG: hypothetical protein WC815_17280 [Vicinamibacterales bacterium]|jgi:hypothetical protein